MSHAMPADPARMGRRPRRVRPSDGMASLFLPPGLASNRPGVSGRSGARGEQMIHMNVCDLPLLPPTQSKKTTRWVDPAISPRRAEIQLQGFEYGPTNTCAVDTFLTIMRYALTKHERLMLKRGTPLSSFKPDDQCHSSSCSVPLSSMGKPARAASRASRRGAYTMSAALKALRDGEPASAAKRKWYEYICSCDANGSHASSGKRAKHRHDSTERPSGGNASLKCCCKCKCDLCLSGQCVKCSRCSCKRPCGLPFERALCHGM